jgi:hypothetical protein
MPLERSLLLILLFLLNDTPSNAQSLVQSIHKDTTIFTGNYYHSAVINYRDGKFGLKNENARPGRRFWRSQRLIGGTEILGMGLLMALPKSITKWDDDYLKKAKHNIRETWTKPPVWDKDGFAMNYVAHPLVGSYYYNAMRSQGSKRFPAFLFSTAQSVLWEYCIEGVAERPSTQDLLITSTAGALIGEAVHRSTLRMSRDGFTTLEKIIVTIINPLFVLNNKLSYRLNEPRAGTIYSLHK